MTTSLDTSILRLHVTMAEPDAPETLLAVSEKFRNLDALLLVCSLAHQSETAEQPIIDEKSLEFTKVSLFAAHQDAASFVVARVRYESPWRLVLDYGHLLVGGGGLAALYAIARKAMTLVDRANETRERYWQANAKIAEHRRAISACDVAVAENKAALAQLKLAQAREQAEADQVFTQAHIMVDQTLRAGLPLEDGPSATRRAARALLDITNIDLEGEPSPE